MNQTILHICKYYAPDVGGIETVAKYLVEGLTDFHHVVVCFSTDGQSHSDVINGITVHRFAPAFKIFSQDVVFSYYWKLKKVMRDYQPDIINIHCPNPFVYPIVFALAPKHCKITLHWHADILSKGLAYYLIKPFEAYALRHADLVIATSPNYVHPTSPIYTFKDKIEILPNGVITANFDIQEGDKERIEQIKKQYANKPLVLFVGRHVPYKGIDILIAAEQYIHSDCEIIILGQGAQTTQLKHLVQSEHIHFVGKVSNDDLRCYLHAADIFALPSLNKAEAFGLALAEAMYCGCASVTFHIEGSGVNWVSTDGETGVEVTLRDVRAYANAIDHLLSDKNLLNTYQQNSHKRVSDLFTVRESVNKANHIFKHLSEKF